MAWVLTCNIAFDAHRGRKAFELRRVVSVTIESSVETLTDTAKIELPRKLYFALGLNESIRTGDPVRIELGYNKQLNKEFSGYVARTNSAEKVEIVCEDEMWKLKQMKVHGLWPKTTLKSFLGKTCPGYVIDAGDWSLGDVKARNTNVAAVLGTFQDEYNILSFFDGKKLVAGKHYSYRNTTHSIALDALQLPTSLEYFDASELKVKVKAQSLLAGGKKIETEVGDDDGTESKLLYSNIESVAELKKLASEDLARLKRSGFRGDFDWIGRPQVFAGEKVALSSAVYPERSGTYHVDAVTKTWSASGFRQKIKLGIKI